jgi:hypothetical protein
VSLCPTVDTFLKPPQKIDEQPKQLLAWRCNAKVKTKLVEKEGLDLRIKPGSRGGGLIVLF